MRKYVFFYTNIAKSRQKLKIELFRHDSIVKNAKKFYSKRIRVKNSIDCERVFFITFEELLTKSFYSIHLNFLRRFFIDLNVNKKFDFEVIIYHVKSFAI